mmetsp:Transcript_2218/g.3214  ORF Transcript_2218/g.3214 Transcript_2218/m.3214 type:complete len:408 (+) Transcript_2218:102-1325(+)
MGRRKIPMELIGDRSTRRTTFKKRKMGLFKKAMELSILTGTQVHVIIFHKDSLHEYMSHDPREILKQYCDKAHHPHERYTNEDYNRFDGRGNVLPLEAVQQPEEEEEEEEDSKEWVKKENDKGQQQHQKVKKYPDSSAIRLSPSSISSIENLNHVDRGERAKSQQPSKLKVRKKEKETVRRSTSKSPPSSANHHHHHHHDHEDPRRSPRHPRHYYSYMPPLYYPYNMHPSRSPNSLKHIPTPTTTSPAATDKRNREDKQKSRDLPSPAFPPGGPSPYMAFYPTPGGNSPYMFPPPGEKSPYVPYPYSPYMYSPHHPHMAYRRKREEKDGPLEADENPKSARRRYEGSTFMNSPNMTPLGKSSPITTEHTYNIDELQKDSNGNEKTAQILTDGGTDKGDISLIATPKN